MCFILSILKGNSIHLNFFRFFQCEKRRHWTEFWIALMIVRIIDHSVYICKIFHRISP